MNQSPDHALASHDAVPLESRSDHKTVPQVSLASSQNDSVLLDSDRMRAVLSGLNNPPERTTLKGIVQAQLPMIRAARRRGWSIAAIAAQLCSGGFPINEATLRKYLNQFDRPRSTPRAKKQEPRPAESVRTPCVSSAPPAALPPQAEVVSSVPRRSLSRMSKITLQSTVHQEKTDA